MWLCLHPRAMLAIAALLLIVLPQGRSEDILESEHAVDKRHVGVLARTGQLPFQGKRSYSSLARNGDLPFYVRKEWNKKMHPMLSGGRNMAELLQPAGKRYVGALAKSGGLPFSRTEGKRSEETNEVTDLLRSVLATEELWQLQMKVLEEELGRQQELEPMEEEKRNVASLARSGNLPFKEGKRSVEALARAGYLPVPKQPQESEEYQQDSSEESEELLGKRSIASLAKNGQLGAQGLKDLLQEQEDKRGGIASLARNGYMYQKRAGDEAGDDLDELIEQLYQEEQDIGKRNIGSLARGFSLPYSGGKRNLGSLARGGGLRFGGVTKKSEDEEEDKRSVVSLIRNRINPLQEGKRYLGAIMRNQVSKKDNDEEDQDDVKRNIGAMARNWNLPDHLKYGKRLDEEDLAQRYIESVLKQSSEPTDDELNKRHIGSIASKGSFQIHKKSSRSTGSDDAAYNNTAEVSGKSKRSVSMENQIPATTTGSDGAAAGKREKRSATFLMPASEEFPMPVMQNSDLFDYEDLAELLSGGAAPEKRFLGRIPNMGRSRPRTSTPSGRRRPHSRNI